MGKQENHKFLKHVLVFAWTGTQQSEKCILVICSLKPKYLQIIVFYVKRGTYRVH